MDEKKIARINELYHRSKAEGLTEAEKKEQADLRREYIETIRKIWKQRTLKTVPKKPCAKRYARNGADGRMRKSTK